MDSFKSQNNKIKSEKALLRHHYLFDYKIKCIYCNKITNHHIYVKNKGYRLRGRCKCCNNLKKSYLYIKKDKKLFKLYKACFDKDGNLKNKRSRK